MKTQQKINIALIGCLFVMVAAAGAAPTEISDREQLVTEQLPRPAHIWVYDFAATAADVPADSVLAGLPPEDAATQTDEHIAEGKQLGTLLATDLVDEIRAMGLPAENVVTGTKPEINDLVIGGYLITFVEGDAKKRIGIGFGAGASDLKVAAEGFQVTDQGLRKLGFGEVDAEGGKSPGAILGAVVLVAKHNPVGLVVSSAVKIHGEKSGSAKVEGRDKQAAKEIAEELKKQFQKQGWIK